MENIIIIMAKFTKEIDCLIIFMVKEHYIMKIIKLLMKVNEREDNQKAKEYFIINALKLF